MIEVGITPNRGDCLSVLGIAREFATCYELRLKREIDMDNVITLGLGRVLQILTDEKINAHLLYRVVEIKQAYLPLDIALALARNGTLSEDIVCNFLEFGTYMTGVILNAYKLRECESKDIVLDNGLAAQLRIKKDENGLEAVFANEKLSVIGVSYGERHFGIRSEILIIEASYVNPNSLAKALYDNAIKGDTQLTYRTTRGSNPDLEQGIEFLCKKMVSTSDVLVYSGSHNIAQSTDEVSIKTTFGAINQLIGTELEKEEIAMILKRLDFKLDATCDENFFMISVPPYRHDIHRIQDVAEEVMRIYGIDNIPSTPLYCLQTHNANSTYFAYKYTRDLAHRLIANGFVECIHYVFASSQDMGIKAHLNISIGCDKKCSYCIVPFTRGKEISIPIDLLVNEAKKLVANGAKELLLLGQNVNHYGVRFSTPHKKTNFTELLATLSEIEGLYRIRFTSPHPLHMDDEFLEEFARNPKIAKGIHIPLQSGSSQILKMMRRGYDKQWYLDRIAKLKSLLPNVGIGTDIIVGFPTESEQDFEDTMEVLSIVEFDTLYSFVYSPRPHTSAYSYDKSMLVPQEVAKERLSRLQNLHKQILQKKAQKEIGSIYEVLIENHRDDEGQTWSEGRSSQNKLIKILGRKCPIGSIIQVKVTHNDGGGLYGEFVRELSLEQALQANVYKSV